MDGNHRTSQEQASRNCLQFAMCQLGLGHDRPAARPYVPILSKRNGCPADANDTRQHLEPAYCRSFLSPGNGERSLAIHVRHPAVHPQLQEKRTLHETNSRMLSHQRELQGSRQASDSIGAKPVLSFMGEGSRDLPLSG